MPNMVDVKRVFNRPYERVGERTKKTDATCTRLARNIRNVIEAQVSLLYIY